MKKEIEIWADSFHEGIWCADNMGIFFKENGFEIEKKYLFGFLPQYEYKKDDFSIICTIYGSYKSWNPLPKKIADLIEWGKPDFILFDPDKDEIICAVEETAATPTGNQATQRCERQYGSAKHKIPYWYFISEYGQHEDGGIRRDSIWPTIAGIKLSILNKIPCIVLHYSDENNVENYNSGKGLNLLFTTLYKVLENYCKELPKFKDLKDEIKEQYQLMSDFVLSEWERMLDFLPSENMLKEDNTTEYIVDCALDEEKKIEKDDLLVWPLRDELPLTVKNGQSSKPLLKYDKLAELLEEDIDSKKCYYLSNNAGSGKPPQKDKIDTWINQQKKLYNTAPKVNPPISFTMKLEDFPKTENGNYHITTSKNILYLYDKWGDLYDSIVKAYPRLKGKLDKYDREQPAFIYLSNSLKPGRIFGDPFTGQLSAFSTIFGKFDKNPRIVIVYYPHQVFSQILNKDNTFIRNKGTTLLKELTDYIIFNEGVAISLKDEVIL